MIYFPFVVFRLFFEGSFSLVFYRKERAKFPEVVALGNGTHV